MIQPPSKPSPVDTAIRLALLGALYASAVMMAVAFSPEMGFVKPPLGQVVQAAG